MTEVKINLKESDIPKQWYNIAADLPNPVAPPLTPDGKTELEAAHTPNMDAIADNIRYFVAHGAKGIFMQAAGNSTGAELSDLRNYVMANLLWDPNRNGQQLCDEFLDLHYGKAAPPIRRWRRSPAWRCWCLRPMCATAIRSSSPLCRRGWCAGC